MEMQTCKDTSAYRHRLSNQELKTPKHRHTYTCICAHTNVHTHTNAHTHIKAAAHAWYWRR